MMNRNRCPRAAAILELAISMVLLLILIFGAAEFALVFYARHVMTDAARNAARHLAVRGGTVDDARTTALNEVSRIYKDANFTVVATDAAADEDVVVNISVPWEDFSMGLGDSILQLDRRGSMDVEVRMRKEGD